MKETVLHHQISPVRTHAENLAKAVWSGLHLLVHHRRPSSAIMSYRERNLGLVTLTLSRTPYYVNNHREEPQGSHSSSSWEGKNNRGWELARWLRFALERKRAGGEEKGCVLEKKVGGCVWLGVGGYIGPTHQKRWPFSGVDVPVLVTLYIG